MMETEIAITSEEQLKAVKKLEEVLDILKHTQIKNKESLKFINKPLDDLLSSLKYLPTDPPFSLLPTEIKTNILGYLCNSGTLMAASVCQEWKMILDPQLKKLTEVNIGNHCSNEYECEDRGCCLPEAMIKAFTTLELDIPLYVCHPLTQIDPQTVSEGLASASMLSIEGDCTEYAGDDYYDREPILTSEQKEQLLEALENRNEMMKMVELLAMDLNNLDQDRLVNCLINKNSYLKLDEGGYGPNLDIRKLVEKLKDSTDYHLLGLSMDRVQYPDDLAEDMADALCQLPFVNLYPGFRLEAGTCERLVENLLIRPTRTVYLCISPKLNWSNLIDPDDLKTIVDQMTVVEFRGTFTLEQLEAARSCPGVNVDSDSISKKGEFNF